LSSQLLCVVLRQRLAFRVRCYFLFIFNWIFCYMIFFIVSSDHPICFIQINCFIFHFASPLIWIWHSGDRASWYTLVIKPTRCTNFSNFFFGIKLYMFRRVPLSIIRSLPLYTQQNLYDIYHCCVYSEKKTPDDGQRNCPKHVEFYSKIKFEKLVHLVGYITRISTHSFYFKDI